LVSHTRLKVFENRMLKRIFGHRRRKVAGGWRKLHDEDLHSLYSSQNVTEAIKSRRVRWVMRLIWYGRDGKAEGERSRG